MRTHGPSWTLEGASFCMAEVSQDALLWLAGDCSILRTKLLVGKVWLPRPSRSTHTDDTVPSSIWLENVGDTIFEPRTRLKFSECATLIDARFPRFFNSFGYGLNRLTAVVLGIHYDPCSFYQQVNRLPRCKDKGFLVQFVET